MKVKKTISNKKVYKLILLHVYFLVTYKQYKA